MNRISHSSIWIGLTVGIAGLIVGYGIVIVRQPGDIFARVYSCPAQAESGATCTCNNGAQCGSAECARTCPACSGKAV